MLGSDNMEKDEFEFEKRADGLRIRASGELAKDLYERMIENVEDLFKEVEFQIPYVPDETDIKASGSVTAAIEKTQPLSGEILAEFIDISMIPKKML
ncbi:hypothetical protein LCGC14_2259310, partial [marine sediment metagenome]